jgi:hypothetical protein
MSSQPCVPPVAPQNSSLVLTSENRTRDAHEPSGEPETLWGRMRGKMGDRVVRTRPEGTAERSKKKEDKKRRQVRFAPLHCGDEGGWMGQGQRMRCALLAHWLIPRFSWLFSTS